MPMKHRYDYGEPTQKTARIKVKDQDYATAIAGDQYNCALACAIGREIPEAKNVRVTKNRVAWTEDEQRFSYPTPEVAIQAIIKPLDTKTGELKPITVHLTGGQVRPVKHEEDLLRHREYNRNWRRARNQGQPPQPQSPASRAYGRFTENG